MLIKATGTTFMELLMQRTEILRPAHKVQMFAINSLNIAYRRLATAVTKPDKTPRV